MRFCLRSITEEPHVHHRAATSATHEVINQVPPLAGPQPVRRQPAAGRGARARGRRLGARARCERPGAFWGGEPQEWGALANENPPVLRTHDRYGQPHRRGRVPPGVAPADGAPASADELHALPWNEPASRRARGARGAVHERHAGRGRARLPDHDDVRGGAGAARAARDRRRVGAAR